MTEETKKEEQAPKDGGKPLLPVEAIVSGVLGILGSALGAGWPGVIALAMVGVAIPTVFSWVVNQINKRVDNADLDRAGADSGRTSADLANQAKKGREDLEDMRRSDPPK